jgi:hypothetical protein
MVICGTYQHTVTNLGCNQKEAMTSTIALERQIAKDRSEESAWAIFQGRNGVRFIIGAWPKIIQQLDGSTVFNTYATYFCTTLPGPFLFLDTLLTPSSPICRK